MNTARLLSCPACEGAMKIIDRGGIHIDRCTGCKGVFLDNGELEKLIALMSAADDDDEWLQPPQPQQRPTAPPPVHHVPQQSYEPHYQYQRGHGDKYYNHKYKKKSAMKTFMDIFD